MEKKLRKRKSYTVEEKVEMIKLIDAKVQQVDVATKFNVSTTTLNTIYKNREKILDEWNRGCIDKKHFKSNECGGAHLCRLCIRPVHVICGEHDVDEEGFGQPVTCRKCTEQQ